MQIHYNSLLIDQRRFNLMILDIECEIQGAREAERPRALTLASACSLRSALS